MIYEVSTCILINLLIPSQPYRYMANKAKTRQNMRVCLILPLPLSSLIKPSILPTYEDYHGTFAWYRRTKDRPFNTLFFFASCTTVALKREKVMRIRDTSGLFICVYMIIKKRLSQLYSVYLHCCLQYKCQNSTNKLSLVYFVSFRIALQPSCVHLNPVQTNP